MKSRDFGPSERKRRILKPAVKPDSFTAKQAEKAVKVVTKARKRRKKPERILKRCYTIDTAPTNVDIDLGDGKKVVREVSGAAGIIGALMEALGVKEVKLEVKPKRKKKK